MASVSLRSTPSSSSDHLRASAGYSSMTGVGSSMPRCFIVRLASPANIPSWNSFSLASIAGDASETITPRPPPPLRRRSHALLVSHLRPGKRKPRPIQNGAPVLR